MSNEVRWGDRLRYTMDNLFSRGTAAMVASLAVFSVVIIVIVSAIVVATGFAPEGEESMGFAEAFWRSLMRTLDAGTMGGDTGWGFRILMFVATVGGVFVISALIGVMTTGIEGKMEDLRKGRSRVIEKDHTAILGWSEQIFTILSELMIANENQRRSCVVVLADRDKVEMEDEFRDRMKNNGRTRIVCRTGSPMEMANLEIVSLNSAKSIIVLSPEETDPDPEVIKVVLAIINHPNRRAEPYHIVAELHDPLNLDVARVVGKDEVEWVLTGELVARITAQTSRQSGLSVVYTELLNFGGDEIYLTGQPELAGQTFGQALLSYEKNALLGLLPAGGSPKLNPAMDSVIQDGDRLIMVAEDDDKIALRLGGPGQPDEAAIVCREAAQKGPERALILGWNWRGPLILQELDSYVPAGSEVLVVADIDLEDKRLTECCERSQKQKVTFQRGDINDRRTLDNLNFERFNHVVLLSYSDALPAQQADARTLITLLHLRDICDRHGYRFSIVSEMLDIRNRNLADVTRADDFIVSDRLISLVMAQVSENKHLNAVFSDIFDAEGSEVYLKPAGDYVRLEQPVSFYTVVESARRRNEVAFGYRLQSQAKDARKAYGIVINPAKSQMVTFSAEDHLIVLAEA